MYGSETGDITQMGANQLFQQVSQINNYILSLSVSRGKKSKLFLGLSTAYSFLIPQGLEGAKIGGGVLAPKCFKCSIVKHHNQTTIANGQYHQSMITQLY